MSRAAIILRIRTHGLCRGRRHMLLHRDRAHAAIKVVQQVQGGSLRDCFARLMRNGGLFRGLELHCMLETIGSGCYLGAYAVCKAQLRRAGVGGRPRDPPDLPERLRLDEGLPA